MRVFKKTIIVLLVGAVLVSFLDSCKKGEDDPAISLKSRTARLKGEWELVSGVGSYVNPNYTYTVTYSGTTATTTQGSNSSTRPYSEKHEFGKNNVYKYTLSDDNSMKFTEGFWTFIGGYDDYSKKEMVLVRTKFESVASTYYNYSMSYTEDEMPSEVIRFKRLSSKECIIEYDGTTTYDSNIYRYNIEKTFKKK